MGLVIVVGIVVASVAAPLLPIDNPYHQDFTALLQPPSLAHPLGTDNLGRDTLSRVVYAGRTDLQLGFICATLSFVFGMALGGIAGFYRGIWATVIMRTVDAFLAISFLVLVIAIVADIGPGLTGVYIGIIVISWTIYARITYAEMLSLREQEFMLAGPTLGFSNARIIFRHAPPNLVRPNLALATASEIAPDILALTTLSYLGLGEQPPTPEWGSLIAGGQTDPFTAWWISILPGAVVVVVGIGFSLIAEWITENVGGRRRAAR